VTRLKFDALSALIKLHKECFLKALEENPEDPMQTYAAFSVKAV
jgi:hypothetical protein